MILRLFGGGFLSLAFFLSLFLAGCAPKTSPLIASNPKMILLITPEFRFHEAGFLKHYENRLTLEAYQLGRAFLTLEIDARSVCLNGACYPKGAFSRRFFGERVGYETLLEEILAGRDIFDSQGKSEAGGVVRQEIVSPHYAILYERGGGVVRFRDRINRLTLQLKDTE